jgi:hypothetical protein
MRMTFEELIAALREPGEDGVSPTIYDDLTASYSAVTEGSAAKIAELEETINAQTAEISRLKAVNYDLLMDSKTEEIEEPDTEDSEEPEAGIDSLFDDGKA